MLTVVESHELKDLLRRRASPQALLVFLDGAILDCSTVICYCIKQILTYAIDTDQLEALQTLLSRIHFPAERAQDALNQLLTTCLSLRKPAACELLMSQAPRLETVSGKPVRLPVWQGLASAWEIRELIGLVDRHPGFAPCFAAYEYDMELCNSVASGLEMLQFNSHFAMADPDFAALESCRPSALLRGLLKTHLLGDKDMAQVALQLCRMESAEFTHSLAYNFEKLRPEYVQTLQILIKWAPDDIKVSEEESDYIAK
jgi:hypothetical protein